MNRIDSLDSIKYVNANFEHCQEKIFYKGQYIQFNEQSCTIENCQHPCNYCFNSTKCISCVDSTPSRVLPVCSCVNPYQDDGINAQCQLQCPDGCQTCTSNQCQVCKQQYYLLNFSCKQCLQQCLQCVSETNCTMCKPNRSGNLCGPNPGYYEDSTGNVLTCKVPCLNCSSEDTCTKCVGQNRVLPNCNVADGFYDDGGSDGQPCPNQCKTCSNSTTCLSCKDNFYLNLSMCLPCDLKCKRCQATQDNCLECAQGYFNFSSDPSLIQCQPCPSKCTKCSSFNNCQECKPNRIGNECKPKDGFYEDSTNGNILQCKKYCLLCISENTCSQCKGINRELPSCKPKEGFYDDLSTDDALPCQSSCLNCSSLNHCLNCKIGKYLDSNNKCMDCDSSCYNCSGPGKQNCTECSHVTRDFQNKCQCKDGYFEVIGQNECLQCEYPCQNCISVDQCLSCQDQNLRKSNSSCECLDGYYQNQQKQCEKCQSPCETCNTDPKKCNSCILQQNRSSLAPNCECGAGFFDNESGECQACSIKCVKCSKNPENCLECAVGIGRQFSSLKCGCQPGYYEIPDNKNCQQCPSQCSQCQNENICLTCNNPQTIPPLCLIQNQGFFSLVDQQGIQKKAKCHSKCLECIDSSENCLKCAMGFNRDLKPPSCSCIDGYHDNRGTQQDCIKCPITCSQCVSDSICTQCQEQTNMELNKFTSMCECKHGFFINIKNQNECIRCYWYKNDCYQKCPKSTKLNSKSFVCEDVDIILKNNVIIFVVFAIIFIMVYCSLVVSSKYLFRPKKKVQNNKQEPKINYHQQQSNCEISIMNESISDYQNKQNV